MASETAWQKSLRRSSGEAPIVKNKNIQARRKRLGSIQECDVFDENVHCNKIKLGNPARRRLSTKDSVSDINDLEIKPTKTLLLQSPSKIGKTKSFLKKLPPKLKIPEDTNIKRDIPSPIPLPPGVYNIDLDDDSTSTFGRDVYNYIQVRELQYQVSYDNIIKNCLNVPRKHLTEWLLSVAHHFHCCQETIYYTIDIIDRTLEIKKFKPEYLQLVGVTAFLIASKLEEYYPADIGKLCTLTDDSYTPGEVIDMEVKLLSLLDFKVFGREPMSHIRRFLTASYDYENRNVRELTLLLMDLQIVNLKQWVKKTSKKAALAVLGSLVILKGAKKIDELWTPNMVYYTGFKFSQLREECIELLNNLLEVINDIEYCVIEKYRSVSRHNSLLRKPEIIDAGKVRKAINYLYSHPTIN